MPQVDLSSVCGGAGSGSIAPDSDDPPPPPLDYAPESFFVSRDSELDWLDQNAYIERKNSGKGPTSNPNSNPNPNSIYGSSQQQQQQQQRQLKSSILALPNPHQKTEPKNRRACRPPNIRLFPKRSDSTGRKPASALSEPSSPKVSCMGRVRSRRKHSEPKPGSGDSNAIKKTKTGFWKNLRTLFSPRGGGDKTGCKGTGPDGEPVAPGPKRGTNPTRKSRNGSSDSVTGEPPGLGAMNRFASGRRSDGWAGEIEIKSEPLDRSPIWQRRETEAPADVGVDRDWQSVGPATV